MRASKRQERDLAKRVGGRATPASGAFDLKGDVVSKHWRFEAKQTSKRSISLKADWLEKLADECIGDGRRMALEILFETTNFRSSRFYVLDEITFQSLLDRRNIF
jgi:hypothetical protein